MSLTLAIPSGLPTGTVYRQSRRLITCPVLCCPLLQLRRVRPTRRVIPTDRISQLSLPHTRPMRRPPSPDRDLTRDAIPLPSCSPFFALHVLLLSSLNVPFAVPQPLLSPRRCRFLAPRLAVSLTALFRLFLFRMKSYQQLSHSICPYMPQSPFLGGGPSTPFPQPCGLSGQVHFYPSSAPPSACWPHLINSLPRPKRFYIGLPPIILLGGRT